MGAFDDLIPGNTSSAGAFDDLIPKESEAPSGLIGAVKNVWTGAKQTGRMVGAAGNTYTGDLADVEGYAAASKESAAINTPAEQRKLQEEIAAIDREQGVAGQIGDTLAAAGRNKMGTVQMIAEQAPNSAVALGGGLAGAQTGAALGTMVAPGVGTAVGGALGFLGGMFLGNTLLETGGKALEKSEGGFTEAERGEAIKEGAVKAGVITAVDAATLKMGGVTANAIGGQLAKRAGARAEAEVLLNAGVDMSTPATINAALAADKALYKAAVTAGEKAATSALSVGKKAGIAGTGLGMETLGEGVGEYFGEMAATGKGDAVDATIEALSSFTQSAAETAYNYNKAPGNNLEYKGLISAANEITTPEDILAAPSVDEALQKFDDATSLDATDLLDDPATAQEATPPVREFGALSQGTTGFGAVNELADLVAQERADVEQRRAGLINLQGIQRESALESVDARVAGVQAEETRAARLKLLDDVYTNPEERTPGISFLAALESEFPNNPMPTPEEKAIIAKREQAYQAFNAMPEEPAVDLGIPGHPQAKPNAERTLEQKIAQVDEYLLGGYRLAAGGKKLVNSKGKVLHLNVAQREYLNSLPQLPEMVQPAAPIKKPAANVAQQPESANGTTAAPRTSVLDAAGSADRTGGAGIDAGRSTELRPDTGATVGGAGQGGAVLDSAAGRGAVTNPVIQSLQNRNRNSKASVLQMQAIAANPNPRLLMASPTMENGAPVVTDLENKGVVKHIGNEDAVVTGKREIPFRYAVVEADQLATSNFADGARNPEYAANPYKLVAINNGRTAGVIEAYSKGTALAYKEAIAKAEGVHGINAGVIRGMKKPVLVRLIGAEHVTESIGDESNTTGTLGLSAVEQARNDAGRVDIAALTFNENGTPTTEAMRGFIQAMPEGERQNLAPNGVPTKQAVDRVLGASLYQAYGSEELVELAVQSTEPEARTVIAALSNAAPAMMKLEGAGDLDIRPLIVEAATAVVNAGRQGVSVTKLANQKDLAHSNGVQVVLDMFAQNVRSAKRITEALNGAANYAAEGAAHNAAGDMFGGTGTVREDVLRRFDNDTTGTQDLGQSAGRGAAGQDVQRGAEDQAGRTGDRAAQEVRSAEAGTQQEVESKSWWESLTSDQRKEAIAKAGLDIKPAGWAFISKTNRAAILDARESTGQDARAQAQADMESALAEAGALLRGMAGVMNIVPEDRPKWMPVLVKMFDAAFRLGYYEMKDASRYVRDQLAKLDAKLAKFLPRDWLDEAAKNAAGNMPEGFFDNQGLFEQEAPVLQSYTNAEVLARETAAKKSADEKAKRDSAPSPDEFLLTGSDRPADVGAAHGQASLLDLPSEKTSSAQAGSVNSDQAIIEQYSLPTDTVFSEGKGQLGRGKWIAQSGELAGNLMDSKGAAAKSLRETMDAQSGFAAQHEKIVAAQKAAADKIKDGENPTFSEWKAAFPQLQDGHTYLRQPEISPFLIEHFGLKRNGIKSGIGAAAGDITSDMGAKYPVVYFNKLAAVLVEQPSRKYAEAIRANTPHKPASEMSAAELLRAAADRMEAEARKSEDGHVQDRMTNADKKSDGRNFKLPALHEFVPGDVLQRAHDLIAKAPKAKDTTISAEDRAAAEAALKPLLAKAEKNKPEFDRMVVEIANEVGIGEMLAKVKGIGRAAEKLHIENRSAPDLFGVRRYETEKMRDLLRATIVVKSTDDIQAAIKAIREKFVLDRDRRGERLKDRFKEPDPLGYRDILINVVLKDGTKAEIQINIPAMLAAKDLGHELYEHSRVLRDDDPLKAELDDAQKALYAAAFARSPKKYSSDTENKYEIGALSIGQSDGSSPSSQSSLNQSSPILQKASPPSDSKNLVPTGNLSGNFISGSSKHTIAKNATISNNEASGSGKNTTQGAQHENEQPGARSTQAQGAGIDGGTAIERQSGSVHHGALGGNIVANDIPGASDSGQAGDERGAGNGADGDLQRRAAPSKGDRAGRAAGIPAGRDIPAKSGLNYHFTDSDLDYKGSWLVKARQNIEAIEIVKNLESEGRKATREEQAKLARFIGWGASDIRNKIFDPQIDRVKRAVDTYNDAHEWLTKNGKESLSRYDYASPYYTVTSMLNAAGHPVMYGQEVSKPMLENLLKDKDAIKWLELRDRLKGLLTDEEWATAERSTQYAHYTGKEVVNEMWRALDRLGFKGGAILEPGAGNGVFPGLMPSAVSNNSIYTGIEYDALTGAILKHLQPDERILVESFIDTALPDNFYDVAIGNPPFSDTKVLSDPRYKKNAFALHDYFFAKTMDKVKPGGLVMFVTSRYTMDKQGDKARQYLAERADLLGAIRLPETAFKKNAGTEVVTDILFLRKKVPGETFEGHDWMKLEKIKVKGGTHLINEYFAKNPDMVLGEGALDKNGMYAENQYTVLPNKSVPIEKLLTDAIDKLPKDAYRPEAGSSAQAAQVREIDWNPKAKKEGNYYVADDGRLMQIEGRVGVPANIALKSIPMVKDFVKLRDAVNQAQYDQLNDGDWEASLKALRNEYQSFVKKHGNILQNTVVERTTTEIDEDTGEKVEVVTPSRRFDLLNKLMDDPEYSKLYALESLNEETGEIKEGEFLHKRVLEMRKVANISTPHDALLSVLNDTGTVNLPLIAERIGLNEREVIEALGSSIYESPSQGWQMQDEYLSGNVKKKLKEAKEAAKADKRFERNVEALIAAQPAPVSPADITAALGMNWIPSEVYAQFLREKTGVKATVDYNEHTGQWRVDAISGYSTVQATSDWGTPQRNAADILEAGLTGRPIRVTRTEGSGSDKKTVFDANATEAANQKLKEMRQAFKDWMWQDSARTDKLVALYNDKFNTIVARKFDGRHLTLPGTTSTIPVFDHVKRGAWRVIQTGNTYLAHAVGSGKTWQMVISAMEQKRLGLINKPMMVVPNHMLQQFAQEWLQLYPAARLMVADEKQFHTENRRRFVTRAAMSDLDGVIITHSAFKLLDLDPEFKQKMIQEQLDQMEAAMEEMLDDEGVDDAKKSRSPRVRDIQNRIEKLEEKLKAAMSGEGKDKNVRFDEMGVDMLYVDEAHEFRKLAFTTTRQVKGISSTGSERAFDLWMKTRWLEQKKPGRSLVMASGTPITNTIAELYTVQRFMAPQVLEERGLQEFDAWASMFGEEHTAIEADASGKYSPVTRFSKFVNVPELTQMFREFADVLTSDHLAEMLGDKRPKLKEGNRRLVVTPAVEDYRAYKEVLASRLKKSRDWKPSRDEPNNPDPIIKIIGDGRLAAIDMRFIDPSLPSDPNSKLNQMIDGVIRSYKKYADFEYTDKKTGKVEEAKGATQMVFSDLGFGAGVAEHRGFNARAWFEKRLQGAGIPLSKVAFMSDYKKSDAKQKLFKDFNAGRVRILTGSSKNMGTGVNAQQRLRALHHLDTPWYPSDLEQREGRIIRQGNKNRRVRVFAYSTKDSYDTVMWQMLASKQRFIDQALSGDSSVRTLDDISEVSQFEMATAMTAGDPRAVQLAGLKADIEKYQRLYRAHEDNRMRMKESYMLAGNTIDVSERRLPEAEKLAAKVQDLSGDRFTAKAGKQVFDKRKEWGEALLAKLKQYTDSSKEGREVAGELSGFPVEIIGNIDRNNDGKVLGYYARLEMKVGEDGVILARDPIEDPVGMTIRATNALTAIARKPDEMRQSIADAKSKRGSLEGRMDAPFQFAQELADKTKEAAALEAEMVRDGQDKSDSELVQKAKAFADRHHGEIDQRRKFTNEPYITHPAGVVEVLKTVPHTEEMLAAAWVHDTVEDTKATIEDVRRELGDKVADLVAELTDEKTAGTREEREAAKRERSSKISAEAQTIKLADIIHNLSGLDRADDDFAARYRPAKALQVEMLTKGNADLLERARELSDSGEVMQSVSAQNAGQTVESVTQATARLRASWAGFKNVKVVRSVKEIPTELYLRALRAAKPIDQGTEGIYDPLTKTVYLIAGNIATPERAVWVAVHEVAGHGGIRMLDRGIAAALDHAGKNGFVRKLAKAIAADRGQTYSEKTHLDEAIAELTAAYVTGDHDAILSRYGVKVPVVMRNNLLGMLKRVADAVRAFVARMLGKQSEGVSDADVVAMLREQIRAVSESEQEGVQDTGGAVMASRTQNDNASSRSNAFTGEVMSDFRNDVTLKRHADYKAAKGGDIGAAVRLVSDLVKPESIEAARAKFGDDVAYLPVMALEASGKNQIPNALARHYVEQAGGMLATGILQTNKAYHTGADAMERLIARSEFGGKVVAGQKYVLVDDVSTMGGTLADLASYIQSQGGVVSGAVLLTNASRSGNITPDAKIVRSLEVRHGQAIRELFGVEPSALTSDEAQYLIGFRTTDELRTRAASASAERSRRILSKAQSKPADSEALDSPLASVAPSATGDIGLSYPGIRPPRQRSIPLQGGQAGSSASWDSPEPSMFDDLVYKLQDKNIDLKRVVEAVRSTGAQLAEKYNAYLQEELFHGRAAKRTQDFVNTELKPLLVEMQARGLTMDELDEYLHARHAKEANALIAQRDPNMQDGGSGMTNQEADDYFAKLPADKLKRLDATAAKVDSIIAKTRDLYVSYGLVSKDQADSWAQMFKHYVPLMREDHDGSMGIGQGFSIKGKEVKHRTGSTAAVVDIFANIAMQREKAIVRGEKNRVAVALAGLAKLNPNPDFWTFGKVPTERVLNETTGLVEERIDPTFKSRDNVVIAKIKDGNGQVHERAVIFNEHDERAMRMAQSMKNLDATELGGVLGVSAKITRYFASINTQYNPIFGFTNLVRDVQGAALNLTSTPLAKHKAEVMGYILSAAKGIYLDARAERKGHPATSRWAQLWEELQDEGGMTGYRDLYRNSADRAKAIEHELDPHGWVNSKWGKVFTADGTLKVPLTVAQDLATPIFDWLSDYNLMMEGSTRLAIYKTAIDNGLTKQQAASLAKNTTVNFNRKGQAGQQAGALYAFFNAAMQGTSRIGHTVFDMKGGDIKTLRLSKMGKAIVGGGVLLGVTQALALAAAGFDDDEPPEFMRERNLIFPIGGKRYISIPMPLGYHAITNLGRIPAEFALGGFKNPAEHVVRLIAVFAEAFNPIGSAGLSMQTIAPTAIDPFAALAENRDWTGKPIYKDDFNSMKPTPGFERNKDTASAWAKFMAEGVNWATGGTDYTPGAFSPTADQIDYLIGQVTGGVGRELSKAAQTGGAMVTGEDLPTHKIPLFGRFYGNTENQSSQGNKFYGNLKEINLLATELKGRRDDGVPTDEFKRDNPKYRLIVRAEHADRVVQKLRRQKREMIAKDATRESIKRIEDRITAEMLKFNEAVDQFEARAF